jgi:uncharacterized protein (TIGR03000 family)
LQEVSEMYSVVLMMALSGGSEAIDFGHRGGGCSGGCSGYASAGCYGGGYGGCYGGGGCAGGRKHGHHRRGGSNCCGCSGGNVGCYGGGYGGCYGGGMGGGMVMPPSQTRPAPAPLPAPQKTGLSAPATIVVSVPADAKVTVDGRPTASNSTRRTLITPALEQGAEYVYSLRAEVTRDGQTLAQTQQVTVRAGETFQVPFSFAASSVASR